MSTFVIGAGAGLVSALLFTVVITGSPLAVMLSYVAPLPVIIAALGWNHRAGLVAAAVGALAIGIALRWAAAPAFALGVALPAWWLAYLGLLGRPTGDGRTEWYPIGRLLLWVAAVAGLVTFAGAVSLGWSYEAYVETMRRAIESVLKAELGAGAEGAAGGAGELPGGLSSVATVDTIVAVLPLAAAASFVPMLVINLWGAAKAVSLSGRLPRPWPPLPLMVLPRQAPFALALALAGGFMLTGFAGVLAQALTGALAAAFALQGLAAIHRWTMGKGGRPLILSLVYLVVVIFLIWALPVLAIVGVMAAFFGPPEHQITSGAPPAAPSDSQNRT